MFPLLLLVYMDKCNKNVLHCEVMETQVQHIKYTDKDKGHVDFFGRELFETLMVVSGCIEDV